MSRRDLLLEIGCEELPASYVGPALSQLQELGERLLKEERLIHGESSVYGTPGVSPSILKTSKRVRKT